MIRKSARRQCVRHLQALEERALLATLMVNSLDDSGEGSLRQAVEVANATPGADVIRFAPGLSGNIELSSQLEISDDVRIRGPGQDVLTLSGGDATRVLLVTPNAEGTAPLVTISRLTVANGLASDAPGWPAEFGFGWGGGLYNQGGVVELDQMSFIDNVADGSLGIAAGGAIANGEGGYLYISRSLFEGNESVGIVATSGAINSAPSIADANAGSYVEIVASDFIDNHARAIVGAVSVPGLDPFPGIGLAGAIGSYASELEISRSNFIGNMAFGGSGVLEPAGTAVGGHGSGGAIVSTNFSLSGFAPSSMMLTNSNFEGNAAIGGDGVGAMGGEALGGAVSMTLGTAAVLRNNTFTANVVRGGNGDGDGMMGGLSTGGAVAVSGDSTADLIRNVYTGNAATGGNGSESGPDGLGRGGALGLYIYNIEGLDFGSPVAESRSEIFEENHSDNSGGAIYNFGSLEIRDAVVTNNHVNARPKQVHDGIIQMAGSGFGGGIMNTGNLEVISSAFIGNEIHAADDTDVTGSSFPGPSFPGSAKGGAIYSDGIADISDSSFFENLAQAGNRGRGDFAGTASGGALDNDGIMTVLGSIIAQNRSIAGDDTESFSHNGHALGGGIISGSLIPALDPTLPGASLVIADSYINNNDAIGGNNNQALAPLELLPIADGPNNAFGGGLAVYQGSVFLTDVTLSSNSAIAGDGGASQNGSVAVGGGMFLFDFIGGVDAGVSDVKVISNNAIGGNGTADDPQGGAAYGGGIAVGSLGAFFGAEGMTVITTANVSLNSALGGNGFGTGNGGQAYGGGVANVGTPNGVMLLNQSSILRNRALGGTSGNLGGDGGNASGGGVYSSEAATTVLAVDVIMTNFAIGGHALTASGMKGIGTGGGIFNEGIMDMDEYTRRRTFFNRADVDANIHG